MINELDYKFSELKNQKTLMDENFQKKLLSLIIINENSPRENEDFRDEIIEILKVEYFDGVHTKTLLQYILKSYEKYNTLPFYGDLRDFIAFKESDGLYKDQLLEMCDTLKSYIFHNKEQVQDTSLEFCRRQSLRNALLKSVDQWDKGEYDSIVKNLENALNVGFIKNLGHDYLKDVEKRMSISHRSPIPFLKGLDAKLDGGLSGGELGIILSPTGGGKSMMLVKGAQTALESGKKVLYFTFELSESVIGNRFDAALNDIELKNVRAYKDIIQEKANNIEKNGGRLIIKEFDSGTATVQMLKAHIKQLAKDGFIPDIIFVDYADIMKPSSTYTEHRHAMTSIYVDLRGMAMNLNVPIWTATQGSRSSLNSSTFDLSVISESMGKAQTADVVIGIGRSDEDKTQNKATGMMLKNRNGADGYNFPMYFDTSKIDIRMIESDIDKKIGLKSLNMEAHFQEAQNRMQEN